MAYYRSVYKSVDGRVYNRENTRNTVGTGAGGPGEGFPCMIDIYRCEYYLVKGNRYTKNTVPKEDKDRIIQEYNLVFNVYMNRYINTIDNVWNVLLAKFGPEIARRGIDTYSELVYRSKYR